MYKTILFFILAIISLVLLINVVKPYREQFVSEQVNSPIMYSVIPSLQDSWIGVSLVSPKKVNDNTVIKSGNLRITTSLPSRLWTAPVTNSVAPDGYLIVHLNYCKDDMALLGCGVKYNKNNDKLDWKLFKKESKNHMTKWEEVETPIYEPICSTVYDSDGILLGIHAENGQIYKKKNTLLNSEWTGPYNYDLPMSKIYFDRDGIMVGIHKNTNKIYKKDGFFWKKDKWSRSIVNNQSVMDIVFDYDSCMIGLTKNGLVKQEEPGFLSSFKPYNMDFKNKMKEPMSFDEIIKSRCGFLPNTEEIIDIEHLPKELIEIINLKKSKKQECKNRKSQVRNAFDMKYENSEKIFKDN